MEDDDDDDDDDDEDEGKDCGRGSHMFSTHLLLSKSTV